MSVNNPDSGGADSVIDPAALSAAGARASEPAKRVRKRGRPFGSGSKPKPKSAAKPAAGAGTAQAKAVSLDLSAFTGLLVGISTMLAIRTGFEECEIGEEEMGDWLKSAQKVARHYSVETTQKTLDWIAFLGASGQVFGTRAVAVAVKVRQGQAADRREPGAQGGARAPAARDNVHPFVAPMPAGPVSFGEVDFGDTSL